MKISYVNLEKQYHVERKKIIKIVDKVFSSGNYIGGDDVEIFEKKI